MTLRVGLLGYGRFGSALATLTAEAGMEVRAFDPSVAVPDGIRSPSPKNLAEVSDHIVVAVPVPATRAALESLKPHIGADHLILDVGSVKVGPVAAMAAVLGSTVPWVGTHPLFGTTSLALGERPLTVVVCPNPLHPGAAGRARSFFETIGCTVVERDPEAHDRAMAETHALAFFVAKGILDAGVDPDASVAPPSFHFIARTVEAVRSDATHLFLAIQTENPFAAEARRRFLASLEAADRALSAVETGRTEPRSGKETLAIPDLGDQSPELREVRDLIDDLDRELLALLARRSQIVRRAGRAKARLGRGARDHARETSLLSARRKWAGDLGLDPGSVEDIFHAILRLSRRIQDRSK